MRTDGWNLDPDTFPEDTEYPDLYKGKYGPTEEVMEKADSPLDLLFFFMPRSLWSKIAKESNRYYDQHLNERIDRMYRKQREKGKEVTREEVMDKEAKQHKPIKGHETVRVIGLLMARMLYPHSADSRIIGLLHPSALSLLNLHFSHNADANAETDRAWKVRPVVEAMQKTFLAVYDVPPVLTFGEAVISSRSRHNVTRQYLKDKLHKWGTKLFMTCCADTAYCLRLEVYCGTDQYASELGGQSPTKVSADPNSGPAAVLRNLQEVLPPPQKGAFHTVVTDRFYTPVQLALQLLSRNVYAVGTVQPNRRGGEGGRCYMPTRGPARIRQDGSGEVLPAADSNDVVGSDGRPPSRFGRKQKRRLRGGKRVVVPCPSMMRNYQRWMGGVAIHDQLRRQRYSLHMAMVFRKYYKTIFLGLVDMAIVNAYTVYRETQKRNGRPSAGHAEFLRVLQAQMLELSAADFADQMLSPGPPAPGERVRAVPSEHKLTVFPHWQHVSGVRKRPQHQCKACSDGNKRVYFCDRVRPKHYPGNTLTCHQIWHIKWNNGKDRPRPLVSRDIQMRGLGKKRRHTSESEGEGESCKDGEDDDQAAGE
ncbi:hypothetical protein PC118_g22862 [Phytophthora cactorum]|uniref:PiggyBac transposable element-derived protein domain-containing protein n=1 Tax=Phytophthora cactorum TaxID=29920 RepID=A0A8T1F299_9STRA|nr:hypothetical protein PC118_g22862 [Phytophthora cactorum]KAG3051266.1 hypothetical protein PC122_g22985 [Phytophthora cactorum]